MSHEVTGCDGWCEMYYITMLRLGEEKEYEASKFICPLDYIILVSRLSFSVPINLELETCHTWWEKNKKNRVTVPTSLKGKALPKGWRSQPQEELEPPSPAYWLLLNHFFIEKSVRVCSNTSRARRKMRKKKELTFSFQFSPWAFGEKKQGYLP